MPYICHVGDFSGEVPFYDRNHSAAEILLMAQWCRQIKKPVIFDVGANNGFIATQLAQLLSDRSAKIYAFEPVSSTFAQLKLSIDQLELQSSIVPVCCAISDTAGITKMSYNPRESLFAQIRDDGNNVRAGPFSNLCATVTIDDVTRVLGLRPSLIKIDVEGFEPRVLRGATALLRGDDLPAICFEWNLLALGEVGSSASDLITLLSPYELYYIDDFEGQRVVFGSAIKIHEIDWTCNLFAVPRSKLAVSNWNLALIEARRQLSAKPKAEREAR